MTRVRISSALFTAVVCGLASPDLIGAPFDPAQFDIHKTVTISGTVAKIEFINPHSYLTVNVRPRRQGTKVGVRDGRGGLSPQSRHEPG